MLQRLLVTENQNEIKKQEIMSNYISIGQPNLLPDSEFDSSSIYNQLKENNSFIVLTNFSENEIRSFLQRIQPYCVEPPKKGPRSKFSWIDGCLLLLMYYKSYWEQEKIEAFLNKSPRSVKVIIDKYRSIFNKFLTDEWIKHRMRPIPNSSAFPHVGLNFDHTSIQIPKPFVDFKTAKQFWDYKHKMYSLKKGVGISPTSGYAVLTFSKLPGSVHDYTDLKNNYIQISEFLRKTEEEKNRLDQDTHASWSVTTDKGYKGDETKDTPGLRKLVPIINPQTIEEHQFNRNVYSIHIIERFFGRMKNLWKITSSMYNDQTNFDIDFDNCILLTNEHIRFHKLLDEDKVFYYALLNNQYNEQEEKSRKRKQQVKQYMENKKARLNSELIRS